MKYVGFRLKDDDKKRLDSLLEDGESASAFCQKIVLKAIYDEDRQPVEPEKKKAQKLERGWFRLESFAMKEVRFRARQNGMSLSGYVSSLVLVNVTKGTVLRVKELEAVMEENRQLAAIGRNLNQVARHLNEHYTDTDSVKLDLLNQIQEQISASRKANYDLIKASRRSWGMEERNDEQG